MSPSRQNPIRLEDERFLVVRSLASSLSSGYVIPQHRHSWRQLLYATSGAMTVTAARSSWMIPPGRAVFIPAGCPHTIRMWGTVAMRSLYFDAALPGAVLAVDDCRVISVTALLRELILRVIETGALDGRSPAHQRLLAVLLDEMEAAPLTPLSLPLPEDARARAVAEHVLSAPAGGTSLDGLARRYGASRRTLERLFRGQTGISFGVWQQKVRMLDSIRLLAEGKSVTDAALDTGYTSVSAFIAAFKRTFGATPGRL